MLANNNGGMAFNGFLEMPLIPYKILEVLLTDNSESVENFWKLLKYQTLDALSKPNLTDEEKDNMVWKGDASAQDYNVFMKPLIEESLDTAHSQTQLRMYRYNSFPINQYESMICFEFDMVTNEQTSVVYYKGMLCERTDLLEMYLLNILNGRDLGIGSSVLQYNREMSRSCQSLITINNSKTLYGRSMIMAMRYMGGELGDSCV